MNSRFDQAVEQILNEHVVEEAGTSSLPGAQPQKEKPGFLKTLATNTLKSAGTGLGKLAANTVGVLGTGLGLTQGVGAKVAGGVGSAVKDAWNQSRSGEQPKSTSTPTGPAPTTTPTTPAPTGSGATSMNSLNIPRPAIASLSRQFGTSAAEQAAAKTALETVFPLRGPSGYRSNIPLANVWGAVAMAAEKTQTGTPYKTIATTPALESRFLANLQSELRTLRVHPNDISKLRSSVPLLFKAIPLTASNQNVNTAIIAMG